MPIKERSIFGMSVMTNQEYVIMAKVMRENNPDIPLEQVALEIEALDDMLAIQKMQSVIGNMRRTKTGRVRKDSDYLSFLDRRLDVLVDDIKNLENGNIRG